MSRSIKGLETQVTGPAFRTLLRHWRTHRGLNQIALAEDAGISTRHLSFLETGRSLPSSTMVHRLAECLDVPNADRNLLLVAAGFAPDYPADDFVAEESETYERMLEIILSQQRSFPALAIDEGWNIRQRNTVAAKLFGEYRSSYRLPQNIANNALHILCHPGGLRQFMPNWQQYVEPFVREINREASMASQSPAGRLRDALYSYPGIPESIDQPGAQEGGTRPLMIMQLQRKNTSLSFYTAFTTFVLPFALKPQYMKIECLYPADPATATVVEKLAASPA